jgi:hypothetical protein
MGHNYKSENPLLPTKFRGSGPDLYLNYKERIVVLLGCPLFLLRGHNVACVSLLVVPVCETSNFLLLLGTLITETEYQAGLPLCKKSGGGDEKAHPDIH